MGIRKLILFRHAPPRRGAMSVWRGAPIASFQIVVCIQRIQLRAGPHFKNGLDHAVFQTIYPAVQVGFIRLLPGPLDDGCLGQVHDLFNDIQFNESVEALFFILNRLEFGMMQSVYVFNIPEPHVQYLLVIVVAHGRFYTTASVMTTNNHVLHFQVNNRVLQHTQQVDVRMHNHVGNIAMHEDFAGLRARDFVCRHTTVATTDP